MKKIIVLSSLLLAVFGGKAQQRIVSLNGTISEMLCALGLEQQIAGVDVTSTYPASLQAKPKVGHNRTIAAEGVLSLQPTLVLGLDNQLNPSLLEQLKGTQVKTLIFKQDLSVEGVRALLKEVAKATGTESRAAAVQQQFDQQLSAVHAEKSNKKVLFVYARGAGTMMVGGTGTPVDKLIQLSGGQNAVKDFADFRPLTAEALVAADPDVILLFDSGLKSLGGTEGLLKVPGVAQTRAGQQGKIVTMDGELLSGFGLRLPQAIGELNKKIRG
ncbi:MAG TPA: ABC transporter substrate-binding protein [Puia sp.]